MRARARPAPPSRARVLRSRRSTCGVLGSGVVVAAPAPQAEALEIALLRGRRAGDRWIRTPFGRCAEGPAGAAERDVVVVAVDDLQWLDRETARRCVPFRRLSDERVRLVDVAAPRPVFGAAGQIGRSARTGGESPIGSLSTEAMHRMLRLHAGRTLPRPVLQRGGGRQRLLRAPARALSARGSPCRRSRVPPSLEALTTDAARPPPGPVRRVLEPAACCETPRSACSKRFERTGPRSRTARSPVDGGRGRDLLGTGSGS